MRPLYLYCTLFSLFHCTSESRNAPPEKVADSLAMTPGEKSPFGKAVCDVNEFKYMYDCNQNNRYQIELLQDPFKDFVVITLDLSDSTKDVIFYNRFKYGSPPKTKAETNEIAVINPVTKDTMKFFYPKTSTLIIAPKDRDINNFFSNTIWQLSNLDENSDMLDPETWKIKGRSEGKEIVLSRQLFRDSVFYSNIQRVLDMGGVKDYKFTWPATAH